MIIKKRMRFITTGYGRYMMQEYIGIQTTFEIILRECETIIWSPVIVLSEDLLTNIMVVDTLMREQPLLANN